MPQNNQFCFIFVRSLLDVLISSFYMLGTIMLLIYTYKGYHKLVALGEIARQVNHIYYFIIIWALSFLFQYSVNIFYYYRTLIHRSKQIQNITQFSMLNNTMAAFVAFLIQGLLIEISLNIMVNVLDYNSRQGQIFNSKIMKFYKFIKIYRWFRCLRLLQLVLFIFFSQKLEYMSDVGLYTTQVDSVIVLLIMLGVYFNILVDYLFKRTYLRNKDKKMLKKQYITLIICAMYRCLSLTVFVHKFFRDDECPESNISKSIFTFCLRQPQQIIPLYFIIKIQFWIHQEESMIYENLTPEKQLIQTQE